MRQFILKEKLEDLPRARKQMKVWVEVRWRRGGFRGEKIEMRLVERTTSLVFEFFDNFHFFQPSRDWLCCQSSPNSSSGMVDQSVGQEVLELWSGRGHLSVEKLENYRNWW
jgi:hypothetical protein